MKGLVPPGGWPPFITPPWSHSPWTWPRRWCGPGPSPWQTNEGTGACDPWNGSIRVGNWWVPRCVIGYEHTFINALADFLKGLERGERVRPDFRDALETQAVTDAVLESARLKTEGDRLVLEVAPTTRAPDSEVVAERIKWLAGAMGLRTGVVEEIGG